LNQGQKTLAGASLIFCPTVMMSPLMSFPPGSGLARLSRGKKTAVSTDHESGEATFGGN
jgi:hypothetical protein